MRRASFSLASSAAATAFATMLLTSCGGGEALPSEPSSPDVSRTARVEPRAPALAVRADAAAPRADPGLYDCIDRLSDALLPAGMKLGADIACLVGTYAGRTARNEDCSLTIGAGSDGANLVRDGNSISVKLLRPGMLEVEDKALLIHRVDIDGGQIGLEFRAPAAGKANVTESLVITADEHRTRGRLNDMTYQRAEAGKQTVIRCRFHA